MQLAQLTPARRLLLPRPVVAERCRCLAQDDLRFVSPAQRGESLPPQEERPARLQGVPLATLPDALARIEPVERPLAPSTWGRPRDLSTWDSPRVAEIAFTARRAELRTVAAVSATRERGAALERAVRELLALQASDWAFQITHELAADYPMERVSSHSRELDAALAALTDSGAVSQAAVRNLAPEVELAPLFAT